MAKRTIKRRTKKICSSCGAENPLNAKACKGCSKERFEPKWVKAKRPINRQFSVQITQSNPDFGESSNRITLSKWWPGGRSTLHIPTASQWSEIVKIIDNDLGPLLGWAKAKEFVKKARAREKAAKSSKKELRSLLTEQPDFLKDLVSAIDPKKIGQGDFNAFVETLGEISDVFSNANAGFREAFLRVVKKLLCIPLILATQSEGFRPPIPTEAGHSIRRISATHSRRFWPCIPIERGHLFRSQAAALSERSDAEL